ncbi:MAG: hypothetical protein EBS05_10240 [Proteobacteria bacterium]|nr:hypothetical protein [Pseudomonadota bacterium]
MAGNLRGLRDSANGFDLLSGQFFLPLLFSGEARGGFLLCGFGAGFGGGDLCVILGGGTLYSGLGFGFLLGFPRNPLGGFNGLLMLPLDARQFSGSGLFSFADLLALGLLIVANLGSDA